GGTVDNCTIGGFNRFGIFFDGAGINNWTVTNCRIGVDATGNTGRRNEDGGIFIQTAASGYTISNNIISGNGTMTVVGPGLQAEAGCVACVISNNRVGIAANNTCLGNSGSGLFIKNTNSAATIIQNNIIGCNGYGNMGGQLHGIHLIGCTSLQILNNYIGRDAANTQLGNNQDGVGLHTGTSLVLVQDNQIAFNNWGVFMQGGGGSNIIIGNNIHDNGFTNTPLAKTNINEGGGICAQTGSNTNEIGRAITGQGNILTSNKCGIHLRGDPGGSTGNLVYNNTITLSIKGNYTKYATDYSGTGITASGGSSSNRIGGTGALQANLIYRNAGIGVLVDASDQVEIRRNSIYCNGSTTAERSNTTFAIMLMGGANGAITSPGPLVTPPVMTAATGIAVANTPVGDVGAGDIVEVFYDDECGCQAKQYLGNGILSGTQWSYPPAGNPTPIPAGGYCTPGAPLTGGGTCPPHGLNSVTATRTSTGTSPGRTSQLMDCTPTILPVELISFAVVRNGPNSALLTWITASEKNNAYFEILRSTDGATFVPAGYVQGSGTTSLQQNYLFTDEGLQEGKYYYMLNQVDFDGKGHLSAIKVVSLGESDDINVVPTAVLSGETIRVVNFSEEMISSISMIDVSGQIILEETQVSSVTRDISTLGLAPGMYIIRIMAGNHVVTEKVVIH
ncbi:MAG: T9SS type A sorting domain-containing protein, partial [Cytophagaceae bacterium]|nr:T9SS type A sorting domain-containing protein [Cytophagaceae bacterium]